MNITTKLILTLIHSSIIGMALSYFIFRSGTKLKLMDIPNVRSSHIKPVPRGGGIGIPLAAAAAVLLFARPLFLFILFQVLLSFFIFLDDRKGLPVYIRFLAEIFISLIIIYLIKMEFLQNIHSNYGFAATLFVMFFFSLVIVSTANFFNFMDGINGIAGMISVVSFGSLALYSHFLLNLDHTAIISISIAGAAGGFLLFNFPKPRVFMGDSGSVFTGFLFASLVVLISHNLNDILLLTLFQSVFIVDCISTISLRIYKRENILKPHLNHLYQRLVHGGKMSHVKVTLIYSGFQIIISAFVLLRIVKSTEWVILLWIILFSIYWILRMKLDSVTK